MGSFLFRCPHTGLKVQGWVADDAATGVDENDSYEAVACTACTRTHLINPKNGKVVGADDE